MIVLHRSGKSTPIQPDNRHPNGIITHFLGFCKGFSAYRLFCGEIFSKRRNVPNRFLVLGAFFVAQNSSQIEAPSKKTKSRQKYSVAALYFCKRVKKTPRTDRTLPFRQRADGWLDWKLQKCKPRENRPPLSSWFPRGFVFFESLYRSQTGICITVCHPVQPHGATAEKATRSVAVMFAYGK